MARVKAKQLARFSAFNEKLFEQTAKAESQLYADFSDISMLQIQLILLIDYHQPECTMSKLAESMGLSLAGISQIVDRVVRKEYVSRARSSTDRRVVFAALTEKGDKVIQAATLHRMTVGRDILAKFSEEEQELFLTLCERIVEK